MDAINKDTMKQYFNLLENTLKEHNLLDSPSQLYNVDETGMPLDPKAPNIVTKRGVKKVRYRSSGKKGQVTIVACGNAAGQVIPPLVIFDTKNFNHAWTVNEVSGTKYGLSEKGWITTELFQSWLTEYFLEYAVSKRPLFLLLDGHSTHYQPDLIRYARINDVVMLCLPPHATHETQPLDTGVFKPLKTQWSKVCHNFTQKNPGQVITKFTFNSLFHKLACLLLLLPMSWLDSKHLVCTHLIVLQSKFPHLLLPAQQKTALKKMKTKNLESHLIVKPISAQSKKNYSRNVLLKVMIFIPMMITFIGFISIIQSRYIPVITQKIHLMLVL